MHKGMFVLPLILGSNNLSYLGTNQLLYQDVTTQDPPWSSTRRVSTTECFMMVAGRVLQHAMDCAMCGGGAFMMRAVINSFGAALSAVRG